MERIENECKGCVSYARDHCRLGIIPHISNETQCPCRICLVKTMCDEVTYCKDFMKYRIISNEKRDMDIVYMNQWRNK